MKKLAIITGASSGIGYEITKILKDEDVELLLIAQNEEKLVNISKEIKGSSILALDLSKEESCKIIRDKIKDREIKYLINNAGFGDYGLFKNCDMDYQNKMIDLNIKALTNLSRIFLDYRVKNEKAYLLNVASIASFMPGPLMSTYYATKSYVYSFTKAIRFENRDDKNIVISCLAPGPTRTNFVKASSLEFETLFNGFFGMNPETVARIAIEGLKKEKSLIIPGFFNKISVIGSKFLPACVIEYLTYKAMLNKK